jgi:hypothetical protein
MIRADEIEKEIEQRSPHEFSEIARWILELDQKRQENSSSSAELPTGFVGRAI